MPLLHQIDQPARGGDHNVHAVAQSLDLRLFADPAVDRGHAQGQMFGVSPDILLDLHHEFARRGDDESPDFSPITRNEGRGQFAEDRENERRRFARAGLRDPDEIVTGQNLRDGGGLNGGGFGVTGFLDGFKNIGSEAKGTK